MVCSQYKKADNEFRMFKNDRTDKYTPPLCFEFKAVQNALSDQKQRHQSKFAT